MPCRPSKEGKDGATSWSISYEFSELSAMKEWHLDPKRWRACTKRDRLKMWAFCVASSKMKQMDDNVLRKQMNESTAKTKHSKGR